MLFFVMANIASAQNSGNVTMVADVNVAGAKVSDQVGSVMSVSFILTNGKSTQNNVYYSLRLSPKGKPNTIVDEKVYDEKLVLLENSTTSKTVVYEAPKYLSGEYSLYLFAGNSSGLPLGYSFVGNIKLSASQKSLSVDGNSCSLTLEGNGQKRTFALSASPVVSDGQKLSISCSVANPFINEAKLSPKFETRYQTIYGDLVDVGTISEIFTLKPLEKKTISLKIPTAQNPGTYKSNLNFSDGSNSTNTISISYNVYGFSSNIFNISSDKDFYMRGDVANIGTLWSSNAKEVSSMDVKIRSSRGANCGSSTMENPEFNQSILVSIKKKCYDPNITLTLRDADGKNIAEKQVSVDTTSVPKDSGIFAGKKGAVLLFVLLIVIALLGIFMKKKKIGVVGGISVFLALAFLPNIKAEAATYWIGSQNDIRVIVNVSNTQNPGSTIYNQGDTMTIDGYMDTSSSLTRTVNLGAVTVGNSSFNIFPSGGIPLGPSQPFYSGDVGTFTVNVPTQNGQPVAGSYDVTFTAGVDESQDPIYVVVRPVQVQGPGSLSCTTVNAGGNPVPGTYLEGAVKTAYEVDFYSSIANYNAGIKYDVTGQNLRLRINYYSNTVYLAWSGTVGESIPNTTTLTSALSGQSAYAYGSASSGLITEYYIPGQYVPSDCEYTWWGQLADLTVLDGSNEAVPYQLIPQPPTASIGGTYGVYTGETFDLSWFSTSANSCTGTNFATGGDTSGTQTITVNGDTTYTVNCSNTVDSASDSITVFDLGPRPEGCKDGPCQEV